MSQKFTEGFKIQAVAPPFNRSLEIAEFIGCGTSVSDISTKRPPDNLIWGMKTRIQF